MLCHGGQRQAHHGLHFCPSVSSPNSPHREGRFVWRERPWPQHGHRRLPGGGGGGRGVRPADRHAGRRPGPRPGPSLVGGPTVRSHPPPRGSCQCQGPADLSDDSELRFLPLQILGEEPPPLCLNQGLHGKLALSSDQGCWGIFLLRNPSRGAVVNWMPPGQFSPTPLCQPILRAFMQKRKTRQKQNSALRIDMDF